MLDYVLYAGSYDDVTFQSDTTYLISGTANFFGKVTFEGSAVLKYVTTNYAIIQVFDEVEFRSDDYRPVIFTSRQDRTVGEDLYLAGAPTNYFQALACATPDLEFKHLRISYADYGLHTYSMKLRHAQFTHCAIALYTEHTAWYGGGAEADNVLFYNVGTAFGGGNFATAARHITVNQCGTLASDWYGGSSVAFTNSVLADVTNIGSVSISTNHTVATTGAGFQTAGAGAHYLADGSNLRNAGTTNIPAWLASDLRMRTTWPPVLVTNSIISSNVDLFPIAPRSTSVPDLGFAYAPLDYVYGSNVLSNATLRIFPGAVLGTFTPGSNTHGLLLASGAEIVSAGTPLRPARIVRYNTVQEQASGAWASPYAGASIREATGPHATPPSGSFRFTEWSVPGGEPRHLDAQAGNTNTFSFRDCAFVAGKLESVRPEFWFTNCLFRRVAGYFAESPGRNTNRWYNNTFIGGTWTFYNSGNGPWEIFNNLFYDTQDLGTDSGGPQGWNAYLPGAPLVSGVLSNGIVTNIVFQTGPLGEFYQPVQKLPPKL